MTNPAARARFILEHTRLSRLPLVPQIELYLANEVTELWRATEPWLRAGEIPAPFWAFAWAGGQALARWLLDHDTQVVAKRTIDLACGGGIVAIAARMAGAGEVLAIDIDPFATATAGLNAAANGVDIRTVTANVIDAQISADLVVCGDVFYDRDFAERLLPQLRALAAHGAEVLVGDPGRAYFPREGTEELAVYEVETPLELESTPTKTTRVVRILG